MTNPLLSLWLSGTDAWMSAARSLWLADEMQRQQTRMMRAMGEQAIRLWSGAWMFPAPVKQRSLAERMAALSLRVVEGGPRSG